MSKSERLEVAGKLISVIIPVYNTAEYLARCLDSIICNTYRNLEIICIDDASTDGSFEILEDYKKRDSRIRIIHQGKRGCGAARNSGLEVARGEYIAFIDSDDWIHPMYFAFLMRALQLTNADIAIGGKLDISSAVPVVDLSDMAWESVVHEIALNDVINNAYWKTRVWGRLYSNRILKDIRYDPAVLLEDVCFNYDVIFRNDGQIRFALIDLPLYYYFLRQNSAVHTLTPEMIETQMIWFCNQAKNSDSALSQKLSSIEALKSFLAYRYLLSGRMRSLSDRKSYQNTIKRAEALVRIPMKNIRKTRRCLRIKIQFGLLYRFPELYRCYRIINDPTLRRREMVRRKQI